CSIQLSYGRARGCDKSSPQTSIAAIRKRDRYLMKTRAKSKRARAKTLPFRQPAAGGAEKRSKTKDGRLPFIRCSQDHQALPASSRSGFHGTADRLSRPVVPRFQANRRPFRPARLKTGLRPLPGGFEGHARHNRAWPSKPAPDRRSRRGRLVAGATGPVFQTEPVKRSTA
ncbi:MAG: hypothetical protein ABJO46_21305, partial [Nitratireductor sp.]